MMVNNLYACFWLGLLLSVKLKSLIDGVGYIGLYVADGYP